MNQIDEKAGTTQVEETFRPLFAENWCQTLSEVTTTDCEWNIQFPLLEYSPRYIESSRFSSGNYFFWNIRISSWTDEIYFALQMEKGGNVTIYCTVKVWTPKETKSGTSEIAPAVHHNQLVLTQFVEFFENKTLSDVNLNVGGRTFHAHKIILAAKSKVFAAMFQHKTAESLSNNVHIKDVDPDVFREVLRYMYTGRMSSETLDKMAVGVMAVADKYLLDHLKTECETHLLNSMCADNCAELLALAAQPHPAMHLKQLAVDFLRRFPALVMATDGWKKAKKENLVWSCELIEMLCGRKLLDV
ncbi:speckle-type POZ protein-like [Daphnia magna]|uniref:speckle-type POZ protein-like n=1 Tax=Daphnia magna TaxID=35525 RepID=UPI001E1BC808|nr:speckle-type POZ protein-like [Daphnia magna]XP_045027696.1 speckle-type POZ protein-like [Daphnia magna]